MPPQSSRRALLRATGALVAAGLAGCSLRRTETETPTRTGTPTDESTGGGTATESPTTDGTPTPADGTTYGIVVQNRIEAEDFETVAELSEPQPAVIHLRVSNLDPNDKKIFFEETVELAPGESAEFPEAFTTYPKGWIYAMNAQFDPFVRGGLSRQDNRKDGFTFSHGTDRAPTVNPIQVFVHDIPTEDGKRLFPGIRIRA